MKYPGADISYFGETNVDTKINKFYGVPRLINRTLSANKIEKTTRMKVYNTPAIPILTYGCEVWTMKKTVNQTH